MPGSERSAIPTERILAAIDRAARHDPVPEPEGPGGAPWADIVEHLGFRLGGGAGTRAIRPSMERVEDDGYIVRTAYKKTSYWKLTGKGRFALTKARHEGKAILPESPQHARWRRAQEAAESRIEEFRYGFLDDLDVAAALFVSDTAQHSDAWFLARERLHISMWRVAAAQHILNEWAEPAEDGGADLDEPRDLGDRSELARSDATLRRREGRRDFDYFDTPWVPQLPPGLPGRW